MAGQASISTEILARYAADAAREVDGVRGLADSPLPRRHAVRVSGGNGAVRIELHVVTEWGASIPAVGRRVQERVREYLRSMADVEPAAVEVVVDAVGPEMTTRISGLTGATLETAPTVCHECIWWQTRSGRSADKRKWIREAEDEWGAWGTVYHDDDGRLLGSMQYGPADLFPRARELPAGPASDDAVLVTCAYLTDPSRPWVMQSLFLTAIGDVARARRPRARGVRLPLSRGRDELRALPRPPDDLPRGLPRRLRLRAGALEGPRRARAARARRAAAGGGGGAREGAAGVREAFMPAPAPQRF